MSAVGIALGSNIGDKAANIARAVALLKEGGTLTHVRMSSLYKTPPWGVTEQDWFVNACLTARTRLAPLDLLARLQAVETTMGRVRVQRWGPRLIDLDILYYGDVVLNTPELTLPHPEMHNRGFVMIPLAELRPGLLVGGVRAQDLAARFAGDGVERMG